MTCCRTESRRLPHFWSEERMTRHGLPSPPWFATGTPLPFSGSGCLRSISGGRTQKRPPTHHPWFPSDSAPSLGSVTASPFVGFAPLSYSRSAFSADTRSCQTGWGVSPPSRLPAAADVERTHHEDFHPDSLLGFGPNPVRRICVGLFPHAHLLSHHGPTLQHPCGAGVAGSFTVAREPGRFRPMR